MKKISTSTFTALYFGFFKMGYIYLFRVRQQAFVVRMNKRRLPTTKCLSHRVFDGNLPTLLFRQSKEALGASKHVLLFFNRHTMANCLEKTIRCASIANFIHYFLFLCLGSLGGEKGANIDGRDDFGNGDSHVV